MIDKLMQFVPEDRRDEALCAGAMAALLTGGKVTSLALLGKGLWGMEKSWRARHPEFHGGWAERWQLATDLYEATHQDSTNRALHMAGIPLIAGGAAGLLLSPRFSPPWFVAAGAFTGGWALNLVGHAKYEKKAPAFREDPLSFVAGPVWDLKQAASMLRGRKAQPA